MNEKIKELTKKAFMLAHEANDIHEQEEGEEFSETEFDNVFNQKFAELLILECSELCYTSKLQDSDAHAMNILDHFNIDGAKHWK